MKSKSKKRQRRTRKFNWKAKCHAWQGRYEATQLELDRTQALLDERRGLEKVIQWRPPAVWGIRIAPEHATLSYGDLSFNLSRVSIQELLDFVDRNREHLSLPKPS